MRGKRKKRPLGPYLMAKPLSELIAGDRNCWWAVWRKAVFTKYTPLERDDDDAARLADWEEKHTTALEARVKALKADGWTVTIEDQNWATVQGRSAAIGMKPDIIATRDDVVRVEDVKTGKRKTAHLWQVAEYVVLGKLAFPVQFGGRRAEGALVYSEGIVELPAEFLSDDKIERIWQAVADLVSDEPDRVPSYRECMYCDVPDCPDRSGSRGAATATTELF